MKRLTGSVVILVGLFLSTSAFADDPLKIRVSEGFGCSGPKSYEVASKDEVKSDGIPYFTWDEAKIACDNSTADGKTNWFLPSKAQLNAMYYQLHEKSVGGFANYDYWSSSEYNENFARLQHFYNGHQHDGYKDYDNRVRCVRAF
jgi:Protein of unknown function (DUF1566)